MNSSRRSASTALGAVALLAVAGAATARVCFDVVATDMVYFLVRASETPRLVPLAGFVALFELLLLRVRPRRLLEVFAPFVLVLPFLPFPPSVNLLAAYAAAAGLTVYRAALVGAFDGKSARQFTGRLPLLSGLLTVLMCALGVLASKLAYDRLFLTMSDWGIYTATAWNTFHGEILRGTWPVPDFSAGHFMPGFFFPMSVVFGLLPSVFTAFGCGALALWGSAVLVWLFARKRGFSRPYAAAFGLIWLLYPSVSNLNYTLFYGVNAIVSFIPVFFGFYLLYEAKRYKLAFLVFLFSLTLKETVGIFWLGWGIVSFFEGRRRDGVLYGAIGALYFLLAVKVLIPYFAGADYIFYGQFEQLGGGMTDILLSPFTRPGEFWGQVLRIKNLQLLVLLLLPVFPGALNRPWLLGASALLLGFNFVRGSEEIVNLVLQYQVETIAMFTVALVLGVRAGQSLRPAAAAAGLAPRRGEKAEYPAGHDRRDARLRLLLARILRRNFLRQEQCRKNRRIHECAGGGLGTEENHSARRENQRGPAACAAVSVPQHALRRTAPGGGIRALPHRRRPDQRQSGAAPEESGRPCPDPGLEPLSRRRPHAAAVPARRGPAPAQAVRDGSSCPVRPAAPAGSHGRWNPLLHGDLPAGRKRRCAGPAQAAAET